ncbi:hypothetical protein G1C97_0517 [Bifidobacterium sp. DSM 109959]|uniref:Uncharacterized protein n=1 Tax=Bifidobacterium olomucense TaxID=2675324 RepID=A0A7Y0EW88_9BIFI|nr:hypothetical protein [Bifidobacterium sp. DSM 109959]
MGTTHARTATNTHEASNNEARRTREEHGRGRVAEPRRRTTQRSNTPRQQGEDGERDVCGRGGHPRRSTRRTARRVEARVRPNQSERQEEKRSTCAGGPEHSRGLAWRQRTKEHERGWSGLFIASSLIPDHPRWSSINNPVSLPSFPACRSGMMVVAGRRAGTALARLGAAVIR